LVLDDLLPLKLNMTMMVKSSATRVIGEMRGVKDFSYHSFPLAGIRITRDRMPAAKGMPR
jgi:hypothetical protein